MGWWYWIGVSAGIGAASGVIVSVLPLRRTTLLIDALAAALIGGVVGLSVSGVHRGHWSDVAAGAVAGALGYLGAAPIIAGAVRRGGTRLGLGVIVAGIALLIVGLGFVPVLGFVEALGIPAFAARLKRKQPERYAGLRTLAKD